LAGALASAALVRAGLRVFVGLGVAEDPLLAREPDERPPPRGSGVALTPPLALEASSTETILYSLATLALVAALAAFGLRRHAARRPIALLKELHSGVIGDYVMWFTVGTAFMGGVWALMLR